MAPLVVSTSPQNGETNVSLKSKITIKFSVSILPPTADAVKVTNITQNLPVDVELDFNTQNPQFIHLIINDGNALVGNSMCGSNKYGVLLSGLRSGLDGSRMRDSYSLSFSTEEEDILSMIEDGQEVFEATHSYPKDMSKDFSPESIRVRYSRIIDSSDEAKFIVIPGSPGDLEIIDLLEIQPIEGEIETDGLVVKFTPNVPLEKNTLYSCKVSGIRDNDGNFATPYLFQFSTQRYPYFGSEEGILASEYALSLELASGNVEFISSLIASNSKFAQKIATDADTFGEIDWDNPPEYVYEYVAYKTNYDLAYNTYIRLSSSANKKVLADFEISYTYSLSDLMDLLGMLKRKYQEAQAKIEGITLASKQSALFQKGSSSEEMPNFMNRGFKDLEGTKSW